MTTSTTNGEVFASAYRLPVLRQARRYEYTGLEPEQSLGLGWQNPFHDDDMPHSIKAWSQSLATGEPYSTEYRCRRHDGVWRWMLGRALPMRNSDGQITGWFGGSRLRFTKIFLEHSHRHLHRY